MSLRKIFSVSSMDNLCEYHILNEIFDKQNAHTALRAFNVNMATRAGQYH